ncbi:AAA-domain-containing protein [Hymenopellis radicata]|nr:AAA-domain-containing protein [Hymenopellis radicata]
MEGSSSNVLNKNMQGLWSNHRKTKLNLNAASNDNNEEPPQAASLPTPPVVPEPTEPSPSSAKRKIRSSREDGAKRTKISSNPPPKNYTPPTARLSDLGGVDACVEKMLEIVAMPLCHPEVYLHTGVQPPRGVLLHGPPGCGKTLLANAMAGELGMPFINISAPSIVSGMSGESEKTLRDAFDEAKRVAPCILFIDEIDAVTPKRESAQREMERRIVAQFLTCMDDMSWEKNEHKPVIVIGATNRPDSLDAALRRAGRFDHEISMGVPDDEGRERILRVLCAKLRLEGDFNFAAFAKATPGYVGADLSALTAAAGIIAVKRIFKQLSEGTLTLPSVSTDQDTDMQVDEVVQPSEIFASTSQALPTPLTSSLSFPTSSIHSIAHFLNAHPDSLTTQQLEPLYITAADFTVALTQVQPSSKREGFATVPDVSWADIGALHRTRDELHMAIVQPIRRPELFREVGIEAACGTLLAKAVANESRRTLSALKYVGESERAVRQVFSRARASSPCVIFFDELDALVPRRDDNLSESSARVVNTLLTELDGLDARKSVYVIAATNRPDMIDPAMLLYVDLPRPEERAEIVRTMTRKVPLGCAMQDVEDVVRERCDGFSGADLAALVREAGVIALRRTLGALDLMDETSSAEDRPRVTVGIADFVSALDKVGPSVSVKQRKKYEALKSKLAGSPVTMVKDDKIPSGDGEPEKDIS